MQTQTKSLQANRIGLFHGKDLSFSQQYLIYVRRSTDDAINQRNSIEYQLEQCLRYAHLNKLPVANFTLVHYSENGIIKERHTAFKTKPVTFKANGSVQYDIERPKFQQLVQHLARGEFSGVICLSMDRISRNTYDAAIIKELRARGCDIRFVQANYEETSAGHFHMDMDSAFATHHSRVTSEKVRATYAKLRTEGKCTYRTPLGYRDLGPDNKPFDNKRAPLVKQLFERYATGEWSLEELAVWARQHGLTAKPRRRKRTREEILAGEENKLPLVSRPLTRTGVASILNNRFYVGLIRYDKEWLPGNHQPLITRQLFEQVQRRLKERYSSVHYLEKEFFCYRGFLNCTCGRSYSPYEQKGHIYYRSPCKPTCPNTARNLDEGTIDAIVEELFGRLYLTEAEAESLAQHLPKHLEQRRSEGNRQRQSLEARRERINRDHQYLRENKITLLREGVYTMNDFAREEQKLEDELADVEAQEESPEEPSADEMLETLLNFSELMKLAQVSYNLATPQEKHNIVLKAFSELTLKDGKLAGLRAREGLDALLNRGGVLSCGQDYLVSELLASYTGLKSIYQQLRIIMPIQLPV